MNKKMIGAGIALVLIITAISVNIAYAGMYGRAVMKSLEINADEHFSEMQFAKVKETELTNERIMNSLRPDMYEHSNDVSASREYGEVVAVEIEKHNREKAVKSIVSSGTKGEYQLYAWSRFEEFGWDENDLVALINLWNRESGWNTNAHNSSSGAHGIPQALPASRMAKYGSDYMTGYKTQIEWGLNYIASRYGSPTRAWGHFCSRNWY